ncbi:MAG TPA: response regulator [Stellaceae bacterium]|jgi:DNA-binding response OmpR family regulator|nr:response regulator [Stellaceae bacterium]
MSAPVLIVDDSLTVRMNLRQHLGGAGLDTVVCATVAEARRALAENRFSLIVLDVLLPDGDGVDLLKEIRGNPVTRDIAVMLLSTEAEVRDRIRGLQTGADDYLGKPYEPAYLVARARELVRTGNEAAGAAETILVIDDSVTYREALRDELERAEFCVITASSGEEGLRIAAERQPAAIIVDGILPGADGASVIRRIRLDVALRGTPCLLLTGSDDVGAEIRALESGADAFIRKEEEVAVVLARLTATLRSAGTQSERALAGRSPAASLHAPKRILTVDDSETYLHAVADSLRGAGYEVVPARSGEEALDLLAVQPVDCILLDLLMPGIGGEETCRRIKAAPTMRDTPIIMLTALEDREVMIRGLSAGADDYIAKSGEFDVLRARVLAQMRRRQFEDENRRIREELLRKELEAAEARAAVEDQLRQTQKMEALGQLTGGIAHDFNNLLGVIVSNADLLLDFVKGDPQPTELTNEILASAAHGAALTHRLLAFARQQSLSSQIVELNAQLPRVVMILQRTLGEQVAIKAVLGGDLWLTSVDPTQIEDALLNLAINARDAMPGGGSLTIETANMQLDEHYAALHPDVTPGDYVMLAMTDTGTGMPPEVIERATEPFFTTKEIGKGTGLGLSMIYGFAKQSGGHLNIYSEVGVGTTIRLYLPRAHSEHAPATPPIRPRRPLPTGGEAILLVDDNAALRRATLRRLTGLGYRVEEAEDGPAALALLEAGERFDLLFTDIGLPRGMNGCELAEEARRRHPGLGVLLTTGYGDHGGQNGTGGTHLQHLIRKPYRSDELATALRAALADGGGRDSAV